MAKPINIFDDDNFSKGRGLLPDGPVRWDKFRFCTFDFGKPGNDQNCLMGVAQPMNTDGTENGEVMPIYWPTTLGEKNTGDTELVGPVKGEKGAFSAIAISEANKHGKLFGLADFSIFRDSLKTAAKINPELIDLEEAGTDITNLDGLLTETSKFVKVDNRTTTQDAAKGAAAEKPKEPWKVVIITEILDPKKFGKGGSKAASTNGKGKKEEEAPAKPKAKAKKEVSDEPDDIVEAYLEAELTDDKEGEQPLGLKIGISAWASKTLGKDADVAREAQANLKDNFAALLKAKGWKIAAGKLAKED